MGHKTETRRCPWAIQFGGLATRCKKFLPGHGNKHVGRGLEEFPYQEIEWFRGDRREFQTDREDFYTWRVTDEEIRSREMPLYD